MIDTYLLEQLVAVQDCGTFSAASEKLHLTQPSLTRAMQKLEAAFGVTLFDRSKNRAVLNANGRLAAECAKHILMEEQDMVHRVCALDRSARTISVGVISPGPMFELSPLLSSLYPEMTIATEVRQQEQLIHGLKRGIYQMIILNRNIDEADFVSHPCGTEHLCFIVEKDHRIAKQEQCAFRDMNGESILMASGVGYWDQIVRDHMPDSHFLIQSGLDALVEIIQASSLPHFATDLTIRLYGQETEKACVPISDDAAIEHFYCYCRTKDEKKYLSWFQALERRNV